MDSWLPQVRAAETNAETIAAARARAAAEPSAWADVARAVAAVPDRQADALGALRKVPEAQRDAAWTAAETALVARVAWVGVRKQVDADGQARSAKVDRKDAAAVAAVRKAHAEAMLPAVDAWLAQHGDAVPVASPAALLLRMHFLRFLGREDDALAVARSLTEKHAGTDEAGAAARVVEAAKKAAEPPAGEPPKRD